MRHQMDIRSLVRIVRYRQRRLTDQVSTVLGLFRAAERSVATLSPDLPLIEFNPLASIPGLGAEQGDGPTKVARGSKGGSAGISTTASNVVKAGNVNGHGARTEPLARTSDNKTALVEGQGRHLRGTTPLSFALAALKEKSGPVVYETMRLKRAGQARPVPLDKREGIRDRQGTDHGASADDNLALSGDEQLHPPGTGDAGLRDEEMVGSYKTPSMPGAPGVKQTPSTAAGIAAVQRLVKEYEELALRHKHQASKPAAAGEAGARTNDRFRAFGSGREIKTVASPGPNRMPTPDKAGTGSTVAGIEAVGVLVRDYQEATLQERAAEMERGALSATENLHPEPEWGERQEGNLRKDGTRRGQPCPEASSFRPQGDEPSTDAVDRLSERIGEALMRQARMQGVEPL